MYILLHIVYILLFYVNLPNYNIDYIIYSSEFIVTYFNYLFKKK